MGDIPGNPERRLPQGSPPHSLKNRSNMAIFKVEGGRRLRGEITPQGAKTRRFRSSAPRCSRRKRCIVHNVPQILDVIQLIELLQAMGVERSACPKRAIVPSCRHRPGLPTLGRLLPPGQPPQGFGDAAGSDAGAFRRGLMPGPGGDKTGRRRLGHLLHRLSEAGRHARFRPLRPPAREVRCKELKGCYMLLGTRLR